MKTDLDCLRSKHSHDTAHVSPKSPQNLARECFDSVGLDAVYLKSIFVRGFIHIQPNCTLVGCERQLKGCLVGFIHQAGRQLAAVYLHAGRLHLVHLAFLAAQALAERRVRTFLRVASC